MTIPPETSCCFTGHRKIETAKVYNLVQKLHLEIDYMIGCGVRDFYAGGALGFDTLAALAVLLRKRRGDDVRLHLMIPCPDQCSRWSERDIYIYNDIMSKADSVKVLCDHYHSGVMQMRNRAMVDASRYCICYWDRDIASANKGGTLYTYKYAKKLGRKIINLWDEPPEDVQIEFEAPPLYY